MKPINFECRPVVYLTFIFGIHGLVIIISLTCTITVIYQFCFKKTDKLNSKIQILCVIGEILCFLAIGPGLTSYSFIYNECTIGSEDSVAGQITASVALSLYSLTLTCLYTLFAMRVYYSFNGTLYALSPKIKRWLVIVFAVQMTVNIMAVIGFNIDMQIGIMFVGIIVV